MAKTESPERKQFKHDIFVIALEGGINYWSFCKKYRWSTDGGNTPDLEGFEAVICEEEEEGKEHRIDKAVITKALSTIAKGPVKYLHEDHRARYMVASIQNDACQLDADDADNIVQIGLFGEVVYG